MVDDVAGVHIGQGRASQSAARLFLIDPGGQRRLDDPATRTFESSGQLIDFFGKRWTLRSSLDVLHRFFGKGDKFSALLARKIFFLLQFGKDAVCSEMM